MTSTERRRLMGTGDHGQGFKAGIPTKLSCTQPWTRQPASQPALEKEEQ